MTADYPTILQGSSFPNMAILLILLSSICTLIFTSSLNLGYATPSSSFINKTIFDDNEKKNLEVIKVIPFNNTTPSSLAVDPLRNLVYVSVNPGYPYNYTLSLCSRENVTGSIIVPSAVSACSAIYVIDANSGLINDIIRLRPGEQIKDIDIDPDKRTIFASGEYNYLAEDLQGEGEEIQYEDDVVYIISNITKNNSSSVQTFNDIRRITLYGEIEEGKEGDMSGIAVNTLTNTIYAAIRYFEGGREGVFIIPDNDASNDNNNSGINLDYRTLASNITERIKFIQTGETGPEQVLVDELTNTIYASLEHDDFIAVINGSNDIIEEKIILQKPRAISINPFDKLLYAASGETHWFNIIDTNTIKVTASNTQIAFPIASAVDTIINRVYVADCLSCDDYSFTNGTTIYVLDEDGSAIGWRTYNNIDLKDNQLSINPNNAKLYAIGTDKRSGVSSLYIIDTTGRP